MSVTTPVENPIVNANPIINPNPIENANPIISSPIIVEEDAVYDPNRDFSCGCSATIPAGSRVRFMVTFLIIMSVSVVVFYGIYKMLENIGWI